MLLHIFTTGTNWTPKEHYAIEEERYNDWRIEYMAGRDLPHIEKGLAEGWIKPADENGNPK